jgi:hypothetical protein
MEARDRCDEVQGEHRWLDGGRPSSNEHEEDQKEMRD